MTRSAAVGMAFVAAALLAACSPAGPSGPVHYNGDYPAYSSLHDLCDSSTLVVRATPVSHDVRNIDIGADGQESYMVETVTTVEVDDVVAGDSVERGATVEVAQPGGLYEGVEYIADQFELSEGTTYLLFLAEFDGVPASLLNPTQAAYAVSGASVVEAPNDGALAAELNGRTVDASLCAA